MAGVELKIVTQDEAGMRLDRWFKVHFPGLGFGPLQKLLRSGRVRIDGVTHTLDEVPEIDRKRKHSVEIVVDRVTITNADCGLRIAE